jgi:hypothetical protein
MRTYFNFLDEKSKIIGNIFLRRVCSYMKKDEESLSVNDYRFNYRQTGDELFSERHFSAPNPIVARQMFDLACKKDDLVADEVDMAVWNRWANRWEEVSTEELSDTD